MTAVAATGGVMKLSQAFANGFAKLADFAVDLSDNFHRDIGLDVPKRSASAVGTKRKRQVVSPKAPKKRQTAPRRKVPTEAETKSSGEDKPIVPQLGDQPQGMSEAEKAESEAKTLGVPNNNDLFRQATEAPQHSERRSPARSTAATLKTASGRTLPTESELESSGETELEMTDAENAKVEAPLGSENADSTPATRDETADSGDSAAEGQSSFEFDSAQEEQSSSGYRTPLSRREDSGNSQGMSPAAADGKTSSQAVPTKEEGDYEPTFVPLSDYEMWQAYANLDLIDINETEATKEQIFDKIVTWAKMCGGIALGSDQDLFDTTEVDEPRKRALCGIVLNSMMANGIISRTQDADGKTWSVSLLVNHDLLQKAKHKIF